MAFIFTNEPVEIFEKVKAILAKGGSDLEDMKVAYRDIRYENFAVLWPNNLTKFTII